MTPTCVIGIDPGCKGAMVALHSSGEVRWRRADTKAGYQPHALKRGITSRLYQDALEELAEGAEVRMALVELPTTRPKESAISGQRSGIHVGTWLGLLTALRWPHELIHPSRWAKALGIRVPKGGSQKAEALALVQARLPDLRIVPPSARKPHDGIVDAGAIALAAQAQVLRGRR